MTIRNVLILIPGITLLCAQNANVTAPTRTATAEPWNKQAAVAAVECDFLKTSAGCAVPKSPKLPKDKKTVSGLLPAGASVVRHTDGVVTETVDRVAYYFVPLAYGADSRYVLLQRAGGEFPDEPQSVLLPGYCQFSAADVSTQFRCVEFDLNKDAASAAQRRGLEQYVSNLLGVSKLKQGRWRLLVQETRLYWEVTGLSEHEGDTDNVHVLVDAHNGEVIKP